MEVAEVPFGGAAGLVATIEPFIGTGVISKQPVAFEQYRVRVNGMTSGYIGFAAGSKLCLIRKFGPVEIKELEQQVSKLLERETSATQVPDVPDDLRQQLKDEEEGLSDDDIDA